MQHMITVMSASSSKGHFVWIWFPNGGGEQLEATP